MRMPFYRRYNVPAAIRRNGLVPRRYLFPSQGGSSLLATDAAAAIATYGIGSVTFVINLRKEPSGFERFQKGSDEFRSVGNLRSTPPPHCERRWHSLPGTKVQPVAGRPGILRPRCCMKIVNSCRCWYMPDVASMASFRIAHRSREDKKSEAAYRIESDWIR